MKDKDRKEADITKRNLAERQAAQLAAIVQSSEDAIIGNTLDGHYYQLE